MTKGKEGFLFATARATGVPIYIDVELGTGNADFVLGEKVSPKDVMLKDEECGVKIDPSLLSKDNEPMRFSGGLDVLIYSYYNFMPQSIKNHAAFNAIEAYFKRECPELNFLSVKEFTELISDPEHFLHHNAQIKLSKYFKVSEKRNEKGEIIYTTPRDGSSPKPMQTYVRQFQTVDENGQFKWIEQDLGLPDMLNMIAKARKDIAALPICGGYLAGTEAFKNNSVAYSSQHFSHALMLYKKKILDDLGKEDKLWQYGIIALMLILGTALAVYIVSVAPHQAASAASTAASVIPK